MPRTATTERVRQQAARLRALRERLGVSRVQVTDRLGWSTTQTYDLYERGVSVIRLDQLEDWAAAFGIGPTAFVAVLLGERPVESVGAAASLPTPDDPPWDRLRGRVPDDVIRRQIELSGHDPVEAQEADVEDLLALTDQRRELAQTGDPPPQTRPA